MKQNRLTRDQKEELFELYKTYKYTNRELAKRFNKSISSIACLLNREGLTGKNEKNHFRKYAINQNFFEKINCEENAYFLGFLYADGCNHSNTTKVSMFLKESDKEILIRFRDLLQPTKPLTFYKGANNRNECGIQISCRKISEDLFKLGCIPRKTFTLDFPTEDQVPRHLLRHFMRGFFDGDGWLGKKQISLMSSILFCEKLSYFLIKEFNIKTRPRKKGNVVELIFYKDGTKFLLDWMYKNSNISLKRKYERYLKYHK